MLTGVDGIMVEMEAVQSETVVSVGYDDGASELHVRYRSSPSVYVYQAVPRDLFDRLMADGSKGGFLHREIKGVYAVYRI